ncbi:MAG: alpha/beta hydrolase [SAR324 cluster bacterium]|nr:alpha/beta hydrolase [SAR324 cluster bacterium]
MELELIHQHPQKMKFKHPLLFLHGAFSGAWCWKENYLDYFASQGFECLALSLRGHGESKSHKLLDRLSLKDYQEDLFSVIDQFEEPPIVIGHSIGAYLVQQVQQSEKIHGSVLMASPPPFGMLPVFSQLYIQNPIRFHQWGWGTWMSCFENFGNFHDFEKHFSSGTIQGLSKKQYRHRYGDESKKALWEMCWAVSFSPQRSTKPMLVMGGSEDPLISEIFVRQTADHYSSEFRIVPGADHSMMLGSEWEKSAEALKDWLSRNVS